LIVWWSTGRQGNPRSSDLTVNR